MFSTYGFKFNALLMSLNHELPNYCKHFSEP